MARSEQAKLEAESIIRWSEAENTAYLWTASVATRNEWRANGFVLIDVLGPKNSGWVGKVPLDRLVYKTVKK